MIIKQFFSSPDPAFAVGVAMLGTHKFDLLDVLRAKVRFWILDL